MENERQYQEQPSINQNDYCLLKIFIHLFLPSEKTKLQDTYQMHAKLRHDKLNTKDEEIFPLLNSRVRTVITSLFLAFSCYH